jgi:hypothetical protein
VPLDSERARQTEVRLNLTERGGYTRLPVVRVDEIKYLLLTIGERFAHSVQVNTIFCQMQTQRSRLSTFFATQIQYVLTKTSRI